jgi:putative endonuclease
MREHNGQLKSGAKYTLSKRPVVLVYSEVATTRSAALKREAAIKKLSHAEKQNL